MTEPKPPLSVRLNPELADALEEYCMHTGQTRSYVVQESVAQYLVTRSGPTLSSLAEQILPPVPVQPASPKPRASRQKRFRDYVREKRHR